MRTVGSLTSSWLKLFNSSATIKEDDWVIVLKNSTAACYHTLKLIELGEVFQVKQVEHVEMNRRISYVYLTIEKNRTQCLLLSDVEKLGDIE